MDISGAIWNGDWHYLNLHNQKMIAMLIMRGQKPKYVKVPFFEVTLVAYAKVRRDTFYLIFFFFEKRSIAEKKVHFSFRLRAQLVHI